MISGSCINANKNWQKVEDEYFNSEKQIIFIDDFLSDEALIELREFCLVFNQSDIVVLLVFKIYASQCLIL